MLSLRICCSRMDCWSATSSRCPAETSRQLAAVIAGHGSQHPHPGLASVSNLKISHYVSHRTSCCRFYLLILNDAAFCREAICFREAPRVCSLPRVAPCPFAPSACCRARPACHRDGARGGGPVGGTVAPGTYLAVWHPRDLEPNAHRWSGASVPWL